MSPSARSAIVSRHATSLVGVHAVGALVAAIVRHAVVGTVEAQTSNARVTLNAGSLLKARGDIIGNLAENGDLALDDLLAGAVAHVAGDVADHALAGALVEDALPQCARGVEVLGADFGQEADGVADEGAVHLVEVDAAVAEADGLDGAEVSGAAALVVEGHVAVALEVATAVRGAAGVGGELLVVGADAVTVGVGVGEEAGLEDGVGRGLDARRHVGGVESDLLDLGEVVLDVFIEEELSNLAQRELLLRPDVGQVEDVDLLLLPELLGLLRGHGLEADVPAGVVTSLNRIEQILLGVVRAVVGRVLLCDKRVALLALHVHLCVDPVAVLVDELESVAGVTVHLAPAVGDTAVTHKDHDLVDGLGVLRQVVPEVGRVVAVRKIGLGVALLGVNEVRELGRVAQEENGSVVGNHVPVALLSPELDGETTRVASKIGAAALTTNGRETDGDGALLALLEDVREAQVVQRLGSPIETVGTTALGVDYTLGNTLAVEVGEQIDQVEVLEEQRTVLADTLRLVGVRHGNAITGGVESVLGGSIAVVNIVAVDVAIAAAIGGVLSWGCHCWDVL